MPSSTSSSDKAVVMAGYDSAAHDAPARLTAADRPGVAQPIPVRDIPPRPWGAILAGAVLLFVMLMAGWEAYWRAFGATPGYRNSNGAWAEQRRRIGAGEGAGIVVIGSSRLLFDVQLPVWERLTGERPIQLALEGTSATPILEDLAADPDFTGRLIVGVTPGLFFTGRALRGDVVAYTHDQGPSQRTGHWLSKRVLEPYFAFYDPDFALATVVKRQAWPVRPGLHQMPAVRKLRVSDADRNTRMWSKVETDPDYLAIVRDTWSARFAKPPPDMDTPDKAQAIINAQITRAAAAVEKVRARGGRVIFVRAPSVGPYYDSEQRDLPRAETWDRLLEATGAPGIHFEDHPELQGYELPEWSHLSASEADRFTAALVPIVEREFAKLEAGNDGASNSGRTRPLSANGAGLSVVIPAKAGTQ